MQSIAQLESDIDSSEDDMDTSHLRWASARVPPGSSSLPGPPILKRPLPYRLCEVICAYKLIDILYDSQQQDALPSFENPLYTKQRISRFLLTQVKYRVLKRRYATDPTFWNRTGHWRTGLRSYAMRKLRFSPWKTMKSLQRPIKIAR